MADKFMDLDINTLVGVLFTIVVATLMFFLGINAGRPKLIVCGGGGGGGLGMVNHEKIGFMNDPSFLGMKVDRQSAKIEQTFLQDKDTKSNYLLQNNWVDNDFPEPVKNITINVGERRDLNLFQYAAGSNEYYICGSNIQELSPEAQCFKSEKKEFTLLLRDSIGRQYEFDLIVTNRTDKIQIMFAITISRRLQLIRKSLSALKRALKFSKF